METYTYKKSQEMFARAVKVIPSGIYGHLGPAEGCFIPVQAYPFYVDHADGPYIWDIDGNRFIDYMCAYGPNVLGYNHPEVDQAALDQLKQANCTVLPATIMVELAELLVDTVDSADWAFFAKNGGDVTNLAMLSARAATGRSVIVKFVGGYHGVMPWMQELGYPGIIPEDVDNIVTLPFNRADLLADLVENNPGRIAGVIATPYHHPAMHDNELPLPGFWQEVRKTCTDNGIVLIVDDVRAGFRLNVRGSDYHYGFKADLICFCKALANGYNISALCGIEELKSAVSSVFNTGSYWLSAVPMAAAKKTITILREIDGPKLMKEKGTSLTEGLVKIADEHGFNLKVTGEPAMWNMRLTDDESGIIHQEWVAECVRRGVFFTNHHNLFINCAMSDEDIEYTFEIAHDAFNAVRKNHPEMYK